LRLKDSSTAKLKISKNSQRCGELFIGCGHAEALASGQHKLFAMGYDTPIMQWAYKQIVSCEHKQLMSCQ
jgi:hypothetical protein